MVSKNQDNNKNSPLLEIKPSLSGIKPPGEVIALVDSCAAFSGYSRNEIKLAFLRAVSLPSLDVFTDINERCRVALDILVHKLENRFSSKPKFSYSWKGISAEIAGMESIDQYGHGLFSDPWIATPEPQATIPVKSELGAQSIDSKSSAAHELSLSHVCETNIQIETLQVLKKIDSKLDIILRNMKV